MRPLRGQRWPEELDFIVWFYYLDIPKGAKWMIIQGAEKHHLLGFNQHPNWKMLVCIYLVFNFHVRNLFVWWNLFFLQLTLDIIIY